MLKTKNNNTKIISKILNWYKFHARNLPWRKSNKNNAIIPYYVFISEFMLQQTTVKAVIPKFEKFIEIWPNLKKLSNTNEKKILNFWAGLGYYSRAKNLLKSCKIIAKKHNFKIPKNYTDLFNLPGIGDYTAKAILGIAFNFPTMPVDANIERVIARIYCVKAPIILSKKKIKDLSKNLISKNNSQSLIQALMDFGSLICTPKNPKCNLCVIKNYCLAYKNGMTNNIPYKNKVVKSKPKKFTRAYIVLNNLNEILVRRRPSKGILGSMLEVPNDNWVSKKNQLVVDNKIKKISKKYNRINKKMTYSFSHFDLETVIYYKKVKKFKLNDHNWLKISKVEKSGMPTLMKKIVKEYILLI